MYRRRFLKNLATSGCGLSLITLFDQDCALGKETAEGSLCQSVRNLGPQFLENPLRITGQDGATSCLLPSGDSLWLFGDTMEGPFESIRHHDLTHVLSSTAAIVPAQDYSQGIKSFEYLKDSDGKRARQIVKFAEDEDKSQHRLWPIHSTCVADNVYAFYHKITMDPQRDVFETFELNGMGIARAKIGEFQFERLDAPDGSKEFWKGDQPGFGVFTEQLPDGYLYLWGSYWTGMFLARTRPEQIEKLESYEYLVEAPTLDSPQAEPKWDKSPKHAIPLFDNVPNEMSASYNPYLGKHVAIHVWGRENKLVIRTAPEIYGPWSEPEVFFEPPRLGEADLFTAGKEHPEMRQANGKKVYVTYVNSAQYIPVLLEVTLR